MDAPSVRPGTRAFYSVKDDAMVRDADHALFVWDGKSKGTLRNIVNMAKLGKSSVVYVSPAREFLTVKDVDSLKGLARSGGPSTQAYLDEASSSLEAGRVPVTSYLTSLPRDLPVCPAGVVPDGSSVT